MLRVVTWYLEKISCPLDVRWHFMGRNGAIPVEVGGGQGRDKGECFCNCSAGVLC